MKYKIYGAPGTGKTTYMLNCLEKELENGVPLSRIAFVTHTKAAKEEAKERAKRKFPHATHMDFEYFRTIHGICYRALSLDPANVMQVDDYLKFGDKFGIPFSASFSQELDDDGLPMGWLHSAGNEVLAIKQLSEAKMLSPMSDQVMPYWPMDLSAKQYDYVIEHYNLWKGQEGKFDFNDMLQMYLTEHEFGPLDVDAVFIDEAQDLSRLQWKVMDKIMANAKRVYIAGDDDQSIYGFIGADPLGFYHYPCDEEIILSKTYRLKENIWAFARKIIEQVHERQEKNISVASDGGIVEYWNNSPEFLDYNDDTMIIVRHNQQLKSITKMLEKRGIPYSHSGNSIVGSRRAKSIYAYYKLFKNEEVDAKLAIPLLRMSGLKDEASRLSKEVREHPGVKINHAMALKYGIVFDSNWATRFASTRYQEYQNELIRAIINEKGPEALIDKPKVDLTTYHGSKGREAKNVVLFTNCFHAAWKHSLLNPDDEKRLAYVGATRTKDKLTIIAPTSSMFMRSLIHA